MAEPQRNVTAEVLSVDAFDGFFETGAEPQRDPDENPDAPVTQGLSFKEACDYFGLKGTALRTRIKTGQVAAEKIEGPNGPEWRIFPDRPTQRSRKTSGTATEGLRSGADERLLDMIEDLQQQLAAANNTLQSANYRVGYLENQVSERERDLQEKEQEIKLLTDSQHKVGWWSRLAGKFR